MKAPGMAGHLIRRLNQLSTQVFTARLAACGHDLTSVQFAALDAIAAHPDIDQAGVAEKIAYDRATIGGVIDRLEQKGLVARKTRKRDRRAREVRLTEAGAATYAELLPIVTALQADILAALDPGERVTFMRLAAKAIGASGDADPDQVK